jgi:hypothetical protein
VDQRLFNRQLCLVGTRHASLTMLRSYSTLGKMKINTMANFPLAIHQWFDSPWVEGVSDRALKTRHVAKDATRVI